MKPFIKLLASLEITLGALVLSIVLIFFGTIDQIHIGIHGAVEKWFYTVWVFHWVDALQMHMPVMPGGYLIGFVLLINLIAAMIHRFTFKVAKIGIWMTHVGLIVLLLGEFVSSVFQEEFSMTIDEGGTADFIESFREAELAIIDETDPETNRVYAIPESILEREQQVTIPQLPFNVTIDRFIPNAVVQPISATTPESARVATRGLGRQNFAIQIAETGKMDERNIPSVIVTLFSKDTTAETPVIGTWLVPEFGIAQRFTYDGRQYALKTRRLRETLGFEVTLKDFSHDRYLGTNTPKNFSSDVTVVDKATGAVQDALIYMNNPLRFENLTLYQQGFLKGDKTTILQVVRNPGRNLPYISSIVIALGLLVQFSVSLTRFSNKRKAKAA